MKTAIDHVKNDLAELYDVSSDDIELKYIDFMVKFTGDLYKTHPKLFRAWVNDGFHCFMPFDDFKHSPIEKFMKKNKWIE
jgi:hypothetical protein